MDGLETFVAFQVATSCKLLTCLTLGGMAEGEKIKTINKDYSLVFFCKKTFTFCPSLFKLWMLEVYRRLQLGRPQMFQVQS